MTERLPYLPQPGLKWEADEPEEGVFSVDYDLCLQHFRTTQKSTLLTREETQTGRNIWNVFPEEVRNALLSAFRRLLGGTTQAQWDVQWENRLYQFRAFHSVEGFTVHYEAGPQLAPRQASDGAGINGPRRPTGLTGHPRKSALTNGVDPLFENFFEKAPDTLCILDANWNIRRINPAGRNLLGGVTEGETSLLYLIHPEERDTAYLFLYRQRQQAPARDVSEAQGLLCRCLCTDGTYRWLQWNVAPAGEEGYFTIARDVTVNRQREEKMHQQVQHDILTGLPNRLLLEDRLKYFLVAAQRRKHSVAVLFLDIDRFKRINDTFGHAAGDQVLVTLAERLRDCLREEDTVARLSGDEFVIVLPQVHDVQDAISVAEKVLNRLSSPFIVAENPLVVSVSVGISCYPQDGTTPEQLLQFADQAMYEAKNAGRGRYAICGQKKANTDRTSPREELSLQTELSQAIYRQQLHLHYQPQFDLRKGEIAGAEALMRWKLPGRGMVSPATFIPLAEETGLILPLGAWAMQEAFRQAADWERRGHPIQVSVNLSGLQLSDKRFTEKLQTYLQEIGVPPRLMDLELTERTSVWSDAQAIDTLLQLKELGIHLLIDDFGTGYSALSYLKNLPIDGIKVDRSFIVQIDTNAADEAVVRAIVDLSHTLGLRVIAEGVERPEQRDKLLELGCDVMQGFLFSAALPAETMIPFLRGHSTVAFDLPDK